MRVDRELIERLTPPGKLATLASVNIIKMSSTIAIIELGGKQHLVKQGAKLVVNKLASKEGDTLDLPNMLDGQIVQAKILSHQLGKKVNGLKFKAKTRYFKRYGHRQAQTSVEILSIGERSEPKVAAVKSPAKKTTPKKPAPKRTKKVLTKEVKNV